jgi:hypothetical protein
MRYLIAYLLIVSSASANSNAYADAALASSLQQAKEYWASKANSTAIFLEKEANNASDQSKQIESPKKILSESLKSGGEGASAIAQALLENNCINQRTGKPFNKKELSSKPEIKQNCSINLQVRIEEKVNVINEDIKKINSYVRSIYQANNHAELNVALKKITVSSESAGILSGPTAEEIKKGDLNIPVKNDTPTSTLQSLVYASEKDLYTTKHSAVGLLKVNDNRKICSATLISPTSVLTSAHCFKINNASGSPQLIGHSEPEKLNRLLDKNSVSIYFQHEGEVHAISFVPFDKYALDEELPYHDLAIVTLEHEILNIRPAKLYDKTITKDEKGEIIGFGIANALDSTQPATAGLQSHSKIDINLFKKDGFEYIDAVYKPENNLEKISGSCHGDSGGPIIITGRGTEEKIVGVVTKSNRYFNCIGESVAEIDNIDSNLRMEHVYLGDKEREWINAHISNPSYKLLIKQTPAFYRDREASFKDNPDWVFLTAQDKDYEFSKVKFNRDDAYLIVSLNASLVEKDDKIGLKILNASGRELCVTKVCGGDVPDGFEAFCEINNDDPNNQTLSINYCSTKVGMPFQLVTGHFARSLTINR